MAAHAGGNIFLFRGGLMTSVLAAIIRFLDTLIPPASGTQQEIDRAFAEIVAGFETA